MIIIDPAHRAVLAAEAEMQCDARASSYPGRVAAGRIPEADAIADWRAWTALHHLLTRRRLPDWAHTIEWPAPPGAEGQGTPWPALAAAVDRAIAQGRKARGRKEGTERERIEERLAILDDIAARLARHAELLAELNATLRPRAKAAA